MTKGVQQKDVSGHIMQKAYAKHTMKEQDETRKGESLQEVGADTNEYN